MRRVLFCLIIGCTFGVIGILHTRAKGAEEGESVSPGKAITTHPAVLGGPAEQAWLLRGKTGAEARLATRITQNQNYGPRLLGIQRRVPQQYATVQAGINASLHGDTVVVSEGTYFENIKYQGKRIVVASLYLLDQDTSHISRTIIDGSQATGDSGSAVSFVAGEDTNSVLCGFTVRGGFGTYIPAWEEADGGGVFLWQSGARLVRNIITGNNVVGPNAWGGGVSIVFGSNADRMLIMEDNIVRANSVVGGVDAYGGGVAAYASHYRLTGNLIEGDSCRAGRVAAGSGLAFSASTGVVRDNRLRANASLSDTIAVGCLYFTGSGEIVVENNIVEDNVAEGKFGSGLTPALLLYGGGNTVEKVVTGNVFRRNQATCTNGYAYGAVQISTAAVRFGENLVEDNHAVAGLNSWGGGITMFNWTGTVENNIVAGNSATFGGGIANAGTLSGLPQRFVNNTVTGNAAQTGGGFYDDNQGSGGVLLNNIFWDDNSSTAEIVGPSQLEVHYSDIEGGWVGGTGNIDADPMFVDALYRISSASPCNNTGTDSVQIAATWYRAPLFDFHGNPRPMPVGSHPDMGAHEVQTLTGVGDHGGVASTYRLEQNYPNPFNPSTTISYQLPAKSRVTLKVFDILGREVATLVDGVQEAGYKSVQWDGGIVASGVYFYRLQAGEFDRIMKLTIMK